MLFHKALLPAMGALLLIGCGAGPVQTASADEVEAAVRHAEQELASAKTRGRS